MSTHSKRLRAMLNSPHPDTLARDCMYHVLRGKRLEAELRQTRLQFWVAMVAVGFLVGHIAHRLYH